MALHAASVFKLVSSSLLLSGALYERLTFSDILFLKTRRDSVPKVKHYFEVTIPSYTVDDFKSHFRMSRGQFEYICVHLGTTREFNPLTGPGTSLEKNILMFLWYIGNLESFRSMSDRFNISRSTFHSAIKRTASAIVSLMPTIIKWPSEDEQINATAHGFSQNSQLQNVLGAIDGAHIQIKAPKESPQSYFNRKTFYSVILLASCNSKLEFNYVWTGNPGSTHDATVLRKSDLYGRSDQVIPHGYYLLGDSAFPIQRWLITPFRDCGNLTREQMFFNQTHSKCRQVIERAFGMLKCRFRRLLRFEASDFGLLINSILAACVLHNLCILEEWNLPDTVYDDGFQDGQHATHGHEINGIRIRQQLMQQLLQCN